MATINGTNAGETLTGTSLNDTINAYAGNDIVDGQAGNDTILGYSGDDLLTGWFGNDTIYGGLGADRVNGNYGIDTLYGDAGNDTVQGGIGGDKIHGGTGNDTIYGNEAGKDNVTGINVTSNTTVQANDIRTARPDDGLLIDANRGTVFEVGGTTYIAYDYRSADGMMSIFKLEDNGTLTRTDTMTYQDGNGTAANASVTTTSHGNITSSIPTSNLASFGNALSDITVADVNGTTTLFMSSQNGSGMTAWQINASGQMDYAGSIHDTLGTLREQDMFTASNGKIYFFQSRSGSNSITRTEYDPTAKTFTQSSTGFPVTKPGTAAGTGSYGLQSYTTADGTHYLASSSTLGLDIYKIDGTTGNLTLFESKAATTTAGTINTVSLFTKADGTQYLAYSNTASNEVVLFKVKADGTLFETDRLAGDGSFLMPNSGADIDGEPIIVVPDISGDITRLYTIDKNGDFEIKDEITGVAEGQVPQMVAQASNGSYYLVNSTNGETVALSYTTDGTDDDDIIYADSGDDLVFGQTGNDTIYGGTGNDKLYGGVGNDHIIGEAGIDSVYGGAGDDVISSGDGTDTIYGGAGSDTISGGIDRDVIYGDTNGGTVTTSSVVTNGSFESGMTGWTKTGDGSGVYVLPDSRHSDGVRGYALGGGSVQTGQTVYQTFNTVAGETYTLTFDAGALAADATLGVSLNDGTTDIYNQNYTALLESKAGGLTSYTASFTATSSSTTLTFLNVDAAGGNDIDIDNIKVIGYTTPGADSDIVSGGGGNDVIYGEQGDDLLFGDAGNDTVNGGSGNDTIYGGTGGDVINGATGNDTIYGGSEGDLIYGMSGDDVIYGDTNSGQVITNSNVLTNGGFENGMTGWTKTGGGSGVYALNSSRHTEGTYGYALGGNSNATGQTLAQSFSTVPGETYTLTFDAGAFNVDSAHLGVTLNDGTKVTYNETYSLQGETTAGGLKSYTLTFTATSANTTLTFINQDASLGSDIDIDNVKVSGVPATPGNDIIHGGSGNDIVHGNSGDDTINGNTGNDTLYGDAGKDIIHGNSGDDTINGGTGMDTLDGDTGNDTIHGNSGDDTINGGTGKDTLFGDAGIDTINGNSGDDTINGGTGNDILKGNTGADTIHGNSGDDKIDGGTGGDMLYGDAGIDTINGNSGDDTISGGDNNDIITGGAGKDTISGDAGNDNIHGNSGDDIINGGTGADTLNGDLGNDTIHGNSGDDTINGGTGIDTLNGDAGIDTIHGNSGDDTINGGTGNDILKGDAGVDTIHGNSGDDTIDGNTGNDKLYGDAGVDTIHGNSGDDTIEGGTGNDMLYGDTGNDTINGNSGDDTIEGGAGNDVIDGGAGADTLYGGTGNDTITVSHGDTAYGGDDRDVFLLDGSHAADGRVLTIDGGTGSTAAGDVDDYDIIDFAGSGVHIYNNSFSGTLDADGNSYTGSVLVQDDVTGDVFTVNFTEIEGPICFCRGTMIETINGPVPVEKLKVGDLILTRDANYQPIRWLGFRSVSAQSEMVTEAPDRFSPIKIAAGALGNDYPEQDLYVSPQHRILLRSDIAERICGEREVLVAATKLLELDGVEQIFEFDEVEYYHFLFDYHEIVFANGAEAESLYLGEEAMKALPQEAVDEIYALFPELQEANFEPPKARWLLSNKESRELVGRHIKNQQPFKQSRKLIQRHRKKALDNAKDCTL